MALSPLNQRRWRNFRANRRAVWALRIFLVLFARQGARIFGVDINEAAARETQAIITGEGGTCEVAAGDVTDSAKVALFGWQLRRRDGGDLRQAS